MRPPGVEPSHLDGSIVLSRELFFSEALLPAERFRELPETASNLVIGTFLPNQCCQTAAYRLATGIKSGSVGDGFSFYISTDL